MNSRDHSLDGAEGFVAVLQKPPQRVALLRALLRGLRSQDVDTKPSGSTSPRSSKKARPVLVVEDNPVNQKLAQRFLDRLGYASAFVSDGQQAVEAVRDGDYSVVLMDCQMPVMDGFEATRRIRRLETAARNVPIIALTAYASTEDVQRVRQAGMDSCLAKPFSMESLEKTIDEWIEAPPIDE